MNIGREERAMYVLALNFGNLVFGQRVIEMLVRTIFRDQHGRYSFSDGYLNKKDKKERKRKNNVSTNG